MLHDSTIFLGWKGAGKTYNTRDTNNYITVISSYLLTFTCPIYTKD